MLCYPCLQLMPPASHPTAKSQHWELWVQDLQVWASAHIHLAKKKKTGERARTWPRPTGTLATTGRPGYLWAPSTSEVDPIKFSELPLFSAQLWATSSLFNLFLLREAMYITRKLEITRSSWRVTSFDQLTPARQVPGIMMNYGDILDKWWLLKKA